MGQIMSCFGHCAVIRTLQWYVVMRCERSTLSEWNEIIVGCRNFCGGGRKFASAAKRSGRTDRTKCQRLGSGARQSGHSGRAKCRRLGYGTRQPGHAGVESFGSATREPYHSGNPRPECPNQTKVALANKIYSAEPSCLPLPAPSKQT